MYAERYSQYGHPCERIAARFTPRRSNRSRPACAPGHSNPSRYPTYILGAPVSCRPKPQLKLLHEGYSDTLFPAPNNSAKPSRPVG
jgi:hypothetical protein